MIVELNGHDTAVADEATVATVLTTLELDAGARGIAVAVDAEVVPRGEWSTCRLEPGAKVEVVHAVQGG